MARIRTIKPEFWSDEKVAAISRPARLTLLGIVSAMSDDEGKCRGNPRLVKAAVYPLDDEITADEVCSHLEEIAGGGLIQLYEVEGESYICIPNFTKHQIIRRPSRSHMPDAPKPVTKPVRSHDAKSGTIPANVRTVPDKRGNDTDNVRNTPAGVEGIGVDRKGKETTTPDSGESVLGSSLNGSDPKTTPGGWPAEAALLWGEKIAPVKIPRIAAPLKPVVDAHGWPKAKAGIEAYICGVPEGKANIQAFANNANYWIGMGWEARRTPSGELSMTDANGDLTPLGVLVDTNSRRRP